MRSSPTWCMHVCLFTIAAGVEQGRGTVKQGTRRAEPPETRVILAPRPRCAVVLDRHVQKSAGTNPNPNQEGSFDFLLYPSPSPNPNPKPSPNPNRNPNPSPNPNPGPTPDQEGSFDFLLYVGATMVLCMRDELLEHNDFAYSVKKLQAWVALIPCASGGTDTLCIGRHLYPAWVAPIPCASGGIHTHAALRGPLARARARRARRGALLRRLPRAPARAGPQARALRAQRERDPELERALGLGLGGLGSSGGGGPRGAAA